MLSTPYYAFLVGRFFLRGTLLQYPALSEAVALRQRQ